MIDSLKEGMVGYDSVRLGIFGSSLLWALVLDEGRRSGLDEWRYCKGGGGFKDGARH